MAVIATVLPPPIPFPQPKQEKENERIEKR